MANLQQKASLDYEFGSTCESVFKASVFLVIAVSAAVVGTRVSSTAQAPAPAAAQAQTYRAPRTTDGRPNLNGIWQALNEANWDLEAHSAAQVCVCPGRAVSIPGGIGVVEGGVIPYKPEALAKRKDNLQIA
jgi:hypothetical protein